jgi:hypothetical protein
MSQIMFALGHVVSFNELPANSIALDGYVQGPQIDPANRKFSFDHHGGCLRLVTKATCQQVREALILGLADAIDGGTGVYVNDVDADTVLSVWLLLNPKRATEQKVVELVDAVGLVDAHGPLFKAHWLHGMLGWGPWLKVSHDLDFLRSRLSMVDGYLDGTLEKPAERSAFKSPPGKGFGWFFKTGWQPVESETGFDSLYATGFCIGFLYQEGRGGTKQYTVAKKSDLMPGDLGPGSLVRPVTDVSQFDTKTILGALAVAEQEKNPQQDLAAQWGGGSSIGGSPRNKDGSYSVLTPDEVLKVFQRFVK